MSKISENHLALLHSLDNAQQIMLGEGLNLDDVRQVEALVSNALYQVRLVKFELDKKSKV